MIMSLARPPAATQLRVYLSRDPIPSDGIPAIAISLSGDVGRRIMRAANTVALSVDRSIDGECMDIGRRVTDRERTAKRERERERQEGGRKERRRELKGRRRRRRRIRCLKGEWTMLEEKEGGRVYGHRVATFHCRVARRAS